MVNSIFQLIAIWYKGKTVEAGFTYNLDEKFPSNINLEACNCKTIFHQTLPIYLLISSVVDDK